MLSKPWLWLWVGLVAGLPAAAQSLPPPVAHWPLEGLVEGVAADVSGNGHEARAQAKDDQLPTAVPGIVGQALKFSAVEQQYLEVARWETLVALPAFTVMAWVWPESRSGTYEIIGNKGDKSGDGPWPGWRLRCSWSRGTLQTGTANNLEPQVMTAQWGVAVGFWNHLAATYDGHKMQIFVNCNLVGETEMPEPLLAARRALVIGNYVGRKDAYGLQGLLDEVKIYDQVLSADEIFAAATAGMP